MKEISLRVGAQVMLPKNEILSEEEAKLTPLAEKLVNGSRGVVIGWAPDPDEERPEQATQADGVEGSAAASAESTLYPLVRFLNKRVKLIKPEPFEKEIYLLGTCSRTQVPLALAWALTIHKSQGSSLDYMIAELSKCFADGHAYVAVSRASDLQSVCRVCVCSKY